ncbi:MAG: SdpI family protein [Candidatus Eisenbacteria bacterium]
MKVSWRTEWPHWVLLAGMFALAAANWSSAPDRIPVHWGLSGQPDRWGGRFEGLVLLPLIALAVYALLRWLPRIDPGRANYPAFAGAYATIRLAVLVVIAAVYAIILLAMRGHAVEVATWVPLLIGGMFVIIGNLLGKVRPNWFVGVRTPWTLSSKLSWTRTHRLGGWLLIVIGVLFMATSLVHTRWAVGAVAIVAGVGILGLVVYSYVQWRNDPDKVPPAGTLPE